MFTHYSQSPCVGLLDKVPSFKCYGKYDLENYADCKRSDLGLSVWTQFMSRYLMWGTFYYVGLLTLIMLIYLAIAFISAQKGATARKTS